MHVVCSEKYFDRTYYSHEAILTKTDFSVTCPNHTKRWSWFYKLWIICHISSQKNRPLYRAEVNSTVPPTFSYRLPACRQAGRFSVISLLITEFWLLTTLLYSITGVPGLKREREAFLRFSPSPCLYACFRTQRPNLLGGTEGMFDTKRFYSFFDCIKFKLPVKHPQFLTDK